MARQVNTTASELRMAVADQLAAENAKLREAARDVVDHAMDYGNELPDDMDWQCVKRSRIQALREALNESEGSDE